ncbi:hypothetical protein P3G55_13770 [Leptospira sp. 96542]|nr:hypothetical protein [Leptospira sp. 96542]
MPKFFRMKLSLFVFATFLYYGCTNIKTETRLECLERCMNTQLVCALVVGNQSRDPFVTAIGCMSIYTDCSNRCPLPSSRSTSSSSRSSSSGGSGSDSSKSND